MYTDTSINKSVGVKGIDFKVFSIVKYLTLLVSVGTVTRDWYVRLVKLPILLPISLGAQLLNQHRTCTSQHWQHGHRTPVSHGIGKTILLVSLSSRIPKVAGGIITDVAFSSDGTRIVSGSHDKSVRVWDASMGVELKELKGHDGSVHSVAFSSDGM